MCKPAIREVPRGEKCFCSWPPTWPPWRHVQTSNKGTLYAPLPPHLLLVSVLTRSEQYVQMRSLSRPVRKKLILIYFTAWNVSKQRINKKQHHPIHLQMPFPPSVSKTMGRWSLPVLVDLLKTRATAALVTDLCAFRWRVICLRRAECFTKLMNINTTLATTERNYSTKWVTFVLGVLRAQSERLLNLLSSLFRWSWSTSWGEQYHEECS